ncbi:MAG: LPS export ABC transporter periplasmic protein LptC [Planctomycetia bacterium]|uniref:LPS export ABC transporter periplasmic protein LptC n=1 Tax=Candidatus Brocadia sapporoensis TaxID=392547 RepID=A0A1V6LYQ9_9BACT|nr:LPS export ABC transporter periplasmic protein LptC [Candidatus Brocadia sapporoensis]MCC7239612.1 LPS export ABC transporter periplasmic protein LptC [Candidatus Brocadia sp.]QOJ05790.1 MAG: LPS export ABC transporter periplasmic protein LptC [Planctomycetia bacterium]TVL97747.1 MAG: LPS export ABC transporter periplasmic protein LptC [Candidatus Brocadia sp. BL1]MDG6004759.1 LPS export ABC transporter periplasmic protein LptC [Candidatus Brocadia sp.]OQD45237.1 LPS export ABC transporter 
MTTRRYILIGIPIACILSIIVSIVISKPKGELKSAKRNTPSARQLQNVSGNSKDTVTQTVQGLTMPSYDEQGKEVIIMRGENTILLNDNVYKIISPEIEVTDSANTGDGTQSVFITSENGEMNKTSEEGYLSDNVVIHFDPDTRLNTDSLRYLPEKKLVCTDEPVTIYGKGTKIVGQGCEIDLVNKKMWIKKDAEMEMDGIKNDLFFLSKDSALQNTQTPDDNTVLPEEAGTKETSSEKTYIRSSGQLIFDKQPDSNIMTFNDHVELKKGSSTVFSDKLVIFLDPQTKQTKQAIASGNVLASQGTKIAKGSSLTWDVDTQSATLEDTQKAEFVKDDLNIDAQKIIFYKDTGKIDIPSPGSLKTKIREKNGKKRSTAGTGKANNNVTVTWEGKMNFLDNAREASFEKNIEVQREDSTLLCDNLNVTFNGRDYDIQSLKATEKIHIIDRRDNLFSEAVGDRATWDAKNKVTVLRGQPFALLREGNKRQILAPKVLFYEDGKTVLCEGKGSLYERGEEKPLNQSAEETDLKVNWTKKMLYHDTLKKASFFEEAEATRGGQKLQGDQIDAYLGNDQNIDKIIATGNVYFFSKRLENSEGFGSLFTWDLVKSIAVLTGNPKAELRKGGSRTFSETVYFDLAGNRVTWEGRPHWQIISNEITSSKK